MVKDLIKLCEGREIYIQTHNFPDPDAIASAYGLKQLLNCFNIKSILCYEGKIDKLSTSKMLQTFGIEMFSYDEIKEVMKEADPIICVDSQKHAGNITDFIGDEIACIDHHPTFVEVEYQYKDIRMAGACSSLIAGYYKELKIEPDENTATALLYGLKMDTSQFTRGVTSLDIEMFDYLFVRSNHEAISMLEHNVMEFGDLKAYGAAIDHIQVYDKFGFTVIPFPCPDSLIATLADFILALNEVDVVVVGSKRKDGLKLSVRSEVAEVHAGYLVRDALIDIGNGGGHATMAGGFVSKEMLGEIGDYYDNAIRQRFSAELEKTGYFQIQENS